MTRGNTRILKIGLPVALAACIIANIIDQNTGPGIVDADKYGHVYLPDTDVVTLPKGAVDVSLRNYGSLHVPSALHVTVAPADGDGGPLTLTRDTNETRDSAGKYSSTEVKRIYKMTVPRSAPYRVTTSGAAGKPGANGYAVEFGQSKDEHKGLIWGLFGIAVLLVLVAYGATAVFTKARSAS